MEELENTTPVMDNPEQGPVNPNGLEPEAPVTEPENPVAAEPETPAAEQQSPDFSQLFSENIAESTPAPEQPDSPSETPDLQQSQPEVTAPEATAPTAESNVLEPEFTNVENDIQISEHAFDKQIEHTALDNAPQSLQAAQAAQAAAAQQKAIAEQQKLAWLKQHTSKAKKSGFASGILSGIIIMLLAFAACSLFAKQQVLNAIDYLETLIPVNSLLNKNTVTTPVVENPVEEDVDTEESEVIEEETEEVDITQQYYNRVEEIIASQDEPEVKTEQLRNVLTQVMQENEEPDEELTQYISQIIMDLTINSEEVQQEENTESQEISEEEMNNEPAEIVQEEVNEPSEETQETVENTNNEELSNPEPVEVTEEQNVEPYTITHVNSEEEANWVLPAHCSDLTCYGEDREFIECTSFKMVETLDENAHRIGNGGGCRYKDPSELVYVKFSDAHNSADISEDTSVLTVSMTITPTTNTWGKEIRFKSIVNNPDEIIDYEWDFGDGKSTNSQFAAEASHMYGQKGVYTVTLTVYDKNGNTSTTTESITILEVGESIN